MHDLLATAIGLGLAVSLLFSEFLGLAPGGMVVPGYLALYLTQAVPLLSTLMISLLSYLILRLLSTFLIIYGRRRTVVTVLIAYILGMSLNNIEIFTDTLSNQSLTIIGYIIPGLMAIWYDRQGIVETLATLAIVSVIVRLILILLLGEQLLL